MAKSYSELQFTDNFMFVKILSTYPDLCKDLLELILNTKIRSLKPIDHPIDYERVFDPVYESKGIRFDIYTEDDAGTCYDVEMQAQPDKDLAKRSRYYHSCMDMEQLLAGSHYSELKRSIVIFICKEKINDKLNGAVYTYRYQSQEDPEVYLDDDTVTVVVNAFGHEENISPEMNEFLSFIRTGKADENNNSLASRLHQAVESAKQNGKWSVEYMRWDDDLKDRYFRGKQEGLAEGLAEGKRVAILSMHNHGLSEELISEYTDFSIEEIREMLQ